MRRRRFVRVLGSAVEDAGREVGSLAAERRARYENGELPGSESGGDAAGGLARELPRRLARHVDSAAGGGVEFSARVASPEPTPEGAQDAQSTEDAQSAEGTHGADLGVVLCVDLPEYAVTTGLVAAVHSTEPGSGPDAGGAGLADAAERLLAATPAAFTFAFPVGGTVRVVPAAAVAGVAAADEPEQAALVDAVYSRSVGRFFEEFAEGFVGDRGLAAPVDAADDRDGLAAFQRDAGVRDVLVVEVSAADGRTDAKLSEFGRE